MARAAVLEMRKSPVWPPIRLFALLLSAGFAVGCGGAKPIPPPARPVGPLAIHRPDSGLLVFSGSGETPAAAYAFEGAGGSVRVTMEVEGLSGSNPDHPAVPIVNDVLFKAVGDGRISVAFKRPTPELPNGRVTINCLSGDEDSSAVFEPELWYHQPGAIVTFEASGGEPKERAAPGKEVILGRYVARNIPRDIRLTFKAVFTKEPVAPRTKSSPRPPR
jgi:hypothetical protein